MPGTYENKNTGRTILAVAVLSALGVAGNWLNIPVAFGVTFIFGSIFSVLAVGLFGVWWGAAAALFASSYTYVLWGHPYAIVIFTVEILWIGAALRRGHSTILLIDALFWCTLGPLLVLFFYGGAMKLGAQSVTIVVLKQAINGTLNALIAGVILLYAPLRRHIKPDQGLRKVPYATVLLHITTVFLMIPTVILLLLLNRSELKSDYSSIAQQIKTEANQTERVIGHWLTGNMEAVKAVADLGKGYPLKPSARLQEELERIRRSFPDFHNFYLADLTGTTIAFYPPRNERGEPTIGLNFSDRAYYARLKETMGPVVSDVFQGRGGVFTEIFSISVPIIKDRKFAGFGLGAINLDRLRMFLNEISGQSKTIYTILDRNNANLVSTNPGRKPLDRLPETKTSIEESAIPGVFLRVPGSKKNISIMDAWKDAAFFTKVPIADSGWVLLVEYPVAPLQKHFYETTIQGLIIVSALFLLALLASPWLGRKLTRPLARLSVLSRDLPERIERREPLDWPVTGIAETQELIANFIQTSEALSLKIKDIKAANTLLKEEQVRLHQRVKEQHCLYTVIALTEDLKSPIGEQLQEVAGVVGSGWQYPEIAAVRIAYGGMTCSTPNFIETPWMQAAEATTEQGEVVRISVAYLEERPQEEEGSFLKEERDLLNTIVQRIVDAIDRRLTAEKFREGEEKYRTVADFTYDWETWIGVDNHYRYVSPSCERITGYRGDEFMEDPALLFDITHPEDKAFVKEHFSNTGEEMDVFPLDFRIITKTGGERWINHYCRPVYDREGRLIGRRGSNRDVTEKRQAEIILRESEERYRLLIETANEGIWTMDTDHRTMYINQAMADMLGYAPSEIIGKRVEEFLFSEDMSFHQERMEQRHAGGDEVYERRFKRRDGSSLWTLVSAKALKDDQGHFLGSFAMFTDITERRAAEEMLHQKNRQLQETVLELEKVQNMLQLVIESIPVRVFWKNRDSRFLGCNSLFARDAGFDHPHELFGQDDFAMKWAEQADLYRADDLSVMESGLSKMNIVEPQTTPMGSRIWLSTSKVPLHSSDGEIFGILGVYEDITERKLAEDRLIRSEQKFRSILDQAAEVILLHDLQGRFLDVNQQACRSLGYSKEELLTMNFSDIDPEAIAGGAYQLWASIAEGKRFTFESRLKCKDGSIFPVEVSLGPIEVEEETLVLGISRDVTERNRSEQELRDSEARFKALHNASFGGIAIHDQGIILECNQGLSEMTGYSEAELIGMDGLLLLAEQSRNTVRQNILSGYEKPYEVLGLRKDGTEFPVRLEARNIPYKGQPVRTVEFRDISESKRAEEARKTLQDQLTQAQKLESVGRLAGGVAHDFNNMLGVILGHADMAMEQIDPSHELFEALKEIRKAAERSADLTRQLLAFARRQTVSPKILDLNETVEGMLKMLRRLIGEDINLAWLPARSLWPVKVDPSQIDQVLANLCVNARDAIAGIGKITIETGTTFFDNDYCTRHPGFVPGDFVMLAISDNGCGMDAKTLGRIFEPFFTTKGVGEGTGLGLSTVYGVVKQNNGFINVYSESGHGTTFKLYFPRVEEKKTEKPPAVLKRDLRGKETVLLVEDEEPMLAMGRTILQRYGYEVLATKSPIEALGMVQSYTGPIHLLITDVVMPEMNGKDLRDRLAEIRPGIKTIFMSGYTANAIAHHGVLEEGINFLQKPFLIETMIGKVRDVLDE
jgi:two-component system, cell cycle sensor histidine kinase and response regulator CckA